MLCFEHFLGALCRAKRLLWLASHKPGQPPEESVILVLYMGLLRLRELKYRLQAVAAN